jgi:hypothetical protein
VKRESSLTQRRRRRRRTSFVVGLPPTTRPPRRPRRRGGGEEEVGDASVPAAAVMVARLFLLAPRAGARPCSVALLRFRGVLGLLLALSRHEGTSAREQGCRGWAVSSEPGEEAGFFSRGLEGLCEQQSLNVGATRNSLSGARQVRDRICLGSVCGGLRERGSRRGEEEMRARWGGGGGGRRRRRRRPPTRAKSEVSRSLAVSHTRHKHTRHQPSITYSSRDHTRIRKAPSGNKRRRTPAAFSLSCCPPPPFSARVPRRPPPPTPLARARARIDRHTAIPPRQPPERAGAGS